MFAVIYKFFHGHYHTRYHGIYSHAKQLFVFDLILLATAIFLLISSLFFFFWRPGLTGFIDLSMNIGENRIKSGELVHITFEYANRSTRPLTSSTLAVHLPPGFLIDRTRTPESVFSSNSIFNLHTLEPGARGRSELYGHFWTEPRQEEDFTATLTYQPEGSTRKEQKISQFTALLPESVLRMDWQIATTSFPQKQIPFSITLVNTSNEPQSDLVIRASVPDFILPEEYLTSFSLKAKETRMVTGTLTLSSINGGEPAAFISLNTRVNGHTIPQEKITRSFTLLHPEFEATLRLTSSTTYIEPDQLIPLEVRWKNNGTIALNNLRVRVHFSSPLVDLPATASLNGAYIENGDLILDHTARTALAYSTPQSEDSATFSLKLVSSFANLAIPPNTSFVITPILEGETSSVQNQSYTIPGNGVGLPVAGELHMNTNVRYYTPEGDQLGRGPLPPHVGETTKYWILLQAFTTLNPLKNASFETKLPAGVSFTGKQSITLGPSLAFDEKTRMLSWNYRELPPQSRTGIYFELAVSPTLEQIGKNLNLTEEILFSATDESVQKEIKISQPGLNNVLKKDDQGSRKGSAVAAE